MGVTVFQQQAIVPRGIELRAVLFQGSYVMLCVSLKLTMKPNYYSEKVTF